MTESAPYFMKLCVEPLLEYIESLGILAIKLAAVSVTAETLTHQFSHLYLKHEILKAVTEHNVSYIFEHNYPEKL